MKLTPIAVTPVGKYKSQAFVTMVGGRCGGLQEIECYDYPPSPEGERLRQARRTAGIGLGEAARLLGLTPAGVSGLEQGRYTLTRPQWALALTALARR